jgi:hypothetical protein
VMWKCVKQLRQTRTVNIPTRVRRSSIVTDTSTAEVSERRNASQVITKTLHNKVEWWTGTAARQRFPPDYRNRYHYCEWLLAKTRMLHVTVFSDEARFLFTGYANSCRIVAYGRRKVPTQSVELPLLPCQDWYVGVLFVPFLL